MTSSSVGQMDPAPLQPRGSAGADRTGVDSAQSSGTLSRRPGLAWGVLLTLVAAMAIAGQAIGLRGLVRFAGQKQEWEAAQSQRQVVRGEYDKLIADMAAQADKERLAFQQIKAQVEVDRTTRDQVTGELERVRKELELVRKARDEAVKEQVTANREAQTSTESRKGVEDQVAQQTQEAQQLQTRITAMKVDQDQINKALGDSRQSLQSRLKELESTQQQLKDLQGQIASAQAEWRQTQKNMLQTAADLESTLKDKTKVAADRDAAVTEGNAATKETDKQKAQLKTLQDEQVALHVAVESARTQLKDLQGQAAIVQTKLPQTQTALTQANADLNDRARFV